MSRFRLAALGFLALLVLMAATVSAASLIAAGMSSGLPQTVLIAVGIFGVLVTVAIIVSMLVLPTAHARLSKFVREQRRQSKLLKLQCEALRHQSELLRRQSDSSRAVRRKLEDQQYFQGIYGQIDGLMSLYATLKPAIGFPPMANWAIGADLGAHLVRRVRSRRPRSIVELGSGVSTLLIAMALGDDDCRFVSLDHDQRFARQTSDLLAEHGLSDRVHLVTTPLVEQTVGESTVLWYDLSAVDIPDSIDLLVVDGPPGKTGPLARLPAIPLLGRHLDEMSLVVIDDTHREDEREIVQYWCDHYGLEVTRRLPHAKGAVELRMRSSSSSP